MDLDRLSRSAKPPRGTPLGVAGAGTMGAGIAAAARDAGLTVLLYAPDRAARTAVEGVDPVAEPAGLARCGVVIEAAPEALAVKRELFATLAAAVAPDA